MALASDLAHINISSRHADFLGDTLADVLTATGTTQGTGYPITASINCFTTVTGADYCATLPTILACKYSKIFVRNDDGADTMSVFPAVGESINNLGVNLAFNVTASSAIFFIRASSSKWVTK